MASIWADNQFNQLDDAPPQPPQPSQPPSTSGNARQSSSTPADQSENRSGDLKTPSRLPPRVRTQFGGGLRTVGDAYSVCKALFQEQLERAVVEKPVPNTSITGDSGARSAFLLLLTDTQQRELFLDIASSPASWPRLKSLVGAPPFHFLLPQDAGVLNAAGFARGRANMAYDHGGMVANHHQFGPGQLVDEHTREYRVAPQTLDNMDLLPGFEYFRQTTKDMVLQVKVKKHGVQKKRELFHSQSRKQLLFPQPGETITLRETDRLMSARGLRQASTTQLRVKALWPRSQGASTAAILVGF